MANKAATRRAAERVAGESLQRHDERATRRAANNNDRIRLVVDNTTLNQSFGYDANDRLTSWTGAWGSTELYSYDANGNRRTFSVTGQTLATLAYPSSSNKLSSQTGGAMSYTPAYDATGNITSVGGIAYAYDGRNLLASSTGSGITTNYWVNDLGQRVRKTWNGGSPSHVVFTYEPDGRHLGSYGLTGSVTEETVFLGDTPVGMMVGSTNYYVYADHLGAPRIVTDSSNQLRWEWDEADPFGRILPDQNPGGLGSFNWRRGFPGQFYDAEKSAWHNGFRTYHAAFGRYLQPDPIGLAGGDFSNYGYVGGNPVSRVDPLGMNLQRTETPNIGGFHQQLIVTTPGQPDYGQSFSMMDAIKSPQNGFLESWGVAPTTGGMGSGYVIPEVLPATYVWEELITTPAEDELIRKYLREQEWKSAPYNVFTNSCIDYARYQFEHIKQAIFVMRKVKQTIPIQRPQ